MGMEEVVIELSPAKTTAAAAAAPDPPVAFSRMFEFADRTDLILMILGTIGGIVNGLCLPGFFC
jgi:hypothetical protein